MRNLSLPKRIHACGIATVESPKRFVVESIHAERQFTGIPVTVFTRGGNRLSTSLKSPLMIALLHHDRARLQSTHSERIARAVSTQRRYSWSPVCTIICHSYWERPSP
eukprot:6205655-Pleurochrysis_carterae.AAC.4